MVLVVKVFRLLIKYYTSFFLVLFQYANKTQFVKHIQSNTNSLFLEICIAWKAVIICILYHCNMYWITWLYLYIYIIFQSRTKTSSHLKVDVNKSKNKLKTGIASIFIFIWVVGRKKVIENTVNPLYENMI